ncbi:MAG: NADH-quinone oxidoreductase subunit M [Chloroflexota bacterium]|nr:NADH-quinone oxidoreductase subunit M [Chloroflexota bacterium]
MENYELLLSGITFIPIVGMVVLLIWGNATKKQAALIGILSEGFALAIPLVLLSALRRNDSVIFSFPWIPNMGISFRLSLNWLSLTFLLTEVLVTLAAMIYSLGEKMGEKNSNYYYALLLLFSLGMSGTTLADDVFLFYIFWELMLVASVLLILIWGHGEIRFRVALKYFIITHLGSLMVLVCLITMYVNFGTASITEWVTQAGNLPINMQTFLIVFFIIGFSVKMAIYPLHIWLPDAHTVAPMPVTIILAAAMLSMGTYGILRFPFGLFSLETLQPFAIWMMIAGLVSEVYGALMALAERDIKRIIAFSSVSQMGYILFGLGTLTQRGMEGAIMHVVYHAIVKALLFMVVGIIISVTNERDIQKIGGLGFKFPILCVCAAIGVLGISGMPPLGIFNSEWMIFSGGFDSGISIVLTVMALIGSLLTVIYGLRFFGGIFFGKKIPDSLPTKAPLGLIVPTLAVTIFLIIEGLMPGPLLAWAMKGLTSIVGSFH